MPKRRKRLEQLARSLSGDEKRCPVPSAHDRLLESHFFLHQMASNYHDPEPFRYSLHAFVQAIESVLELLVVETQDDRRFSEYRMRLNSFSRREEMQRFKNVRNAAVHRESLVPDSHISVGWFKYGKPKLWIKTKINPLIPTLQILIEFRNKLPFASPSRMFESEEVGVLREWRLKSAADAELLSVCALRFQEVVSMVAEAHKCAGARFSGESCSVPTNGFQTLLESFFFPELYKVWESSPTEVVTPLQQELSLLEAPWDSAKILHRVSKGSQVHAWVGTHPMWEEKFLTAIISTIDGKEVRKNTAIFFKKNDAAVERLQQPDTED
jgi:hypothetical protein